MYLYLYHIMHPVEKIWMHAFVFPASNSTINSLTTPIKDFVFVHIVEIDGHDTKQETNFVFNLSSFWFPWTFVTIMSKWILNEISIIIQTNEYGLYDTLHSNCSGECVWLTTTCSSSLVCVLHTFVLPVYTSRPYMTKQSYCTRPQQINIRGQTYVTDHWIWRVTDSWKFD
jgi:hypothetical protein